MNNEQFRAGGANVRLPFTDGGRRCVWGEFGYTRKLIPNLSATSKMHRSIYSILVHCE
jgi:hypothetical protein